MAEDLVVAGSKNLHTWSKTIGASLVADEFVLQGEFPYASYFVLINQISVATASDHVLQLMAGSSLNVRVRRIHISQTANVTTAALPAFEIWRLSTAGTGGTSVTPRPFDTADAASGATGMTLPTAKGTEQFMLMRQTYRSQQTSSASPGAIDSTIFDWVPQPGSKPIVIAAGTSNGLAIKNVNATAAGTVSGWLEIVETNFV